MALPAGAHSPHRQTGRAVLKMSNAALAGVAQLVGHRPIKQNVTDSIPGMWVWSPAGARTRGNRSMFLSH